MVVGPVAACEAGQSEARRQQAAVGEVIDRGQQFLARQIAGHAEDHDAARACDARQAQIARIAQWIGPRGWRGGNGISHTHHSSDARASHGPFLSERTMQCIISRDIWRGENRSGHHPSRYATVLRALQSRTALQPHLSDAPAGSYSPIDSPPGCLTVRARPASGGESWRQSVGWSVSPLCSPVSPSSSRSPDSSLRLCSRSLSFSAVSSWMYRIWLRYEHIAQVLGRRSAEIRADRGRANRRRRNQRIAGTREFVSGYRLGVVISRFHHLPTRDAPFDALVSDKRRVKPDVAEYTRRRVPRTIPLHAVFAELVGVSDAVPSDAVHGRQ